MIFRSDLKAYKDLARLGRGIVVPQDLSKLPQLYRASMEFAHAQNHGQFNDLLNQFELTGKYKYVCIDTRTHMLMKGMYPCIPGWHCDDWHRTEELNGQPDLTNVNEVAPSINHLLVIGEVSKTEFLTWDAELPSPQEIQDYHGKESPLYLHYDQMLEKIQPEIKEVEPGTFYTFGPTCFHRGQAAQANGWRTFIRVTESNHREPKNEIRYQTQVYTSGRVSW